MLEAADESDGQRNQIHGRLNMHKLAGKRTGGSEMRLNAHKQNSVA